MRDEVSEMVEADLLIAILLEALVDVRHWFLHGNNVNHVNALQETIKNAITLAKERG